MSLLDNPGPAINQYPAKKRGSLTVARDMNGRKIKGIYTRDGRYYGGFSVKGKWRFIVLKATRLQEAILEKEHLVRKHGGYMPPNRIVDNPDPRPRELDKLFADARRLAQQTEATRRLLSNPENRKLLSEAELETMKAAQSIFEALRRTQK